jgi:hypothetical protein
MTASAFLDTNLINGWMLQDFPSFSRNRQQTQARFSTHCPLLTGAH